MTGRLCLFDAAVAVGTALAILISGFAGFARQCEDVRGEVLRLHILAASDSEEDQRIKYGLRDRMLNEFSEVFSGCADIDAAIAAAKEHKDEMEAAAKNYLLEMGCTDDVRCEIENTYFTTRRYNDVTLPAGDYTAVRFLIGEGRGRNWWCMMFPPLCLPVCTGTLSDEESSRIEDGGFEIRFALFEWIGSWFR